MRIKPDTRVWEVYKNYPKAADVLNRYGICACDSLSTIEKEAKLRKINLKELLNELNKIVEREEEN